MENNTASSDELDTSRIIAAMVHVSVIVTVLFSLTCLLAGILSYIGGPRNQQPTDNIPMDSQLEEGIVQCYIDRRSRVEICRHLDHNNNIA